MDLYLYWLMLQGEQNTRASDVSDASSLMPELKDLRSACDTLHVDF